MFCKGPKLIATLLKKTSNILTKSSSRSASSLRKVYVKNRPNFSAVLAIISRSTVLYFTHSVNLKVNNAFMYVRIEDSLGASGMRTRD